MLNKEIYIGNQLLSQNGDKKVKGELVVFENEKYYRISNYEEMRPFFMSIVSNADHWMFISSNGGLSAGRKNAQSALFPYYTDDKITESSETTGSKTILKVNSKGKTFLWEPFCIRYQGLYNIQRNLYKNALGNKVIFEEKNDDLGLTFSYQWSSSTKFGFVRKSSLINNSKSEIELSTLDGIQNILPYGVNSDLQNVYSNLVDAYKKSEFESEFNLGIYILSAIIVDRAEPSEALKATTIWSTGFENAKYLISTLQLDAFRQGKEIKEENDIRAEKGAYFIVADLKLPPTGNKTWMIMADVNQTRVKMSNLFATIRNHSNLSKLILNDIDFGSQALIELNGSADGRQLTGDPLRDTRHFSNTLFNLMRGGIFDNNYAIEKSDFLTYLAKANKKVFIKKEKLLDDLPSIFQLQKLKDLAEKDSDTDFSRLAMEYMPLKFSRRHGDPSRPWNKFSINTTSEDGSKILDYEGNWRDIFQNWEALAHSYPAFIENMIHKFLNATTFDGYNPYRVTKGGFDWETIEPEDPWSYIGYWGDHQIIYLLKFLEFIEKHYPQRLAKYFTKDMFVYANVPYKIKDYKSILQNPKDTITFDEELNVRIRNEKQNLGADAALLRDQKGVIYKVNLIEKLLATVLAKVSNFIPEGGIWMNTQRPEWNDANNALVGNGVSMVTLYYLRRFLNFFQKVVDESTDQKHQVSEELFTFFEDLKASLVNNQKILSGTITDKKRKIVMDGLGTAGSNYRYNIYKSSFSNKKRSLSKKDILAFIEITIEYIDQSIASNKRSDKLYHSYNLMTVVNDYEVSITHLPEMLEGQVALLSSGFINGKNSVELLDALKGSSLFRHDQYSYILYPDKKLPRFFQKNNISSEKLANSPLIKLLLEKGDATIVEKDLEGVFHFNGNFNNINSLKDALNQLSKDTYGELREKEEGLLLSVFEEVFNHKSFTGRSGTFFGYEGLGSIYWHMVSKLLLSVQETCLLAVAKGETEETIGRLLDHYYEINAGIGVHKSPELYGAFPTDPYSHTPGGKGAQQPGMTGQVKEDILSRFGELGIFVSEGMLQFNPRLLRNEEFVKEPSEFSFTTINKEVKKVTIEKGSLCFTYCQVLIVYKLAEREMIIVNYKDGSVHEKEDLKLDIGVSNMLFSRTGEIEQITVLFGQK